MGSEGSDPGLEPVGGRQTVSGEAEREQRFLFPESGISGGTSGELEVLDMTICHRPGPEKQSCAVAYGHGFD